MQSLVKLNMNSLYGAQIGKDIAESYYCKRKLLMQTEYDENVLGHWRLPNGSYIVKLKKTTDLMIMIVILKTLYPLNSELLF